VSAASRDSDAWILADDKVGHASQSVGLANALGLGYEAKDLRFNAWNLLSNRLLGASAISLDRRRSAELVAPWPRIVISTGRRSAPIARWIARRSGGHTRIIQMGRKGGEVPDWFDAVVCCAHFGYTHHPRRIQTLAPLHAMSAERLARAAERWHGLFGRAPRPHVMLVVGGSTAQHVLDPTVAKRMGEEVGALARAAGGYVFAITSPRTEPLAIDALEASLGNRGQVRRWSPAEAENPYAGYLALADVLIVTGESESMLAEAAATDAPLHIYPLPERAKGFRAHVRRWIAATAACVPDSGRARGLRQLSAAVASRLIASGIVRSSRDLSLLHQGLIAAGIASQFGCVLETGRRPPLDEAAQVAARIRTLVELPAGEARETTVAAAGVARP
jgi:mitochondrial fission protein ELM1